MRAQTWDVAREFLFLRDSLRGENRGGVASKRKIKKSAQTGKEKKRLVPKRTLSLPKRPLLLPNRTHFYCPNGHFIEKGQKVPKWVATIQTPKCDVVRLLSWELWEKHVYILSKHVTYRKVCILLCLPLVNILFSYRIIKHKCLKNSIYDIVAFPTPRAFSIKNIRVFRFLT